VFEGAVASNHRPARLAIGKAWVKRLLSVDANVWLTPDGSWQAMRQPRFARVGLKVTAASVAVQISQL